jgi:hypothetical protein
MRQRNKFQKWIIHHKKKRSDKKMYINIPYDKTLANNTNIHAFATEKEAKIQM